MTKYVFTTPLHPHKFSSWGCLSVRVFRSKCGRLLFKWKYLGTSLRLNCLENTNETCSEQQKIGKQNVMIITTNVNIIRWG